MKKYRLVKNESLDLVYISSDVFAQLYGIRDREEAEAYLNHEVLGKRLREITMALLEHDGLDVREIFVINVDIYFG